MAIVNTNLTPNFEVCESSNCKFITIRDTTGVYNAISNAGGWDATGITNPDPADVTEVAITITDPAGLVYTFDSEILDAPINYFPDVTQLVEYPILATNLGSSGKLVDGIYEFTMTYSGDFGANTYTASKTCEVLLTCQISCCLDRLSKEISRSQCLDCKKEAVEKLFMAKSYVTAAKDAVACGMRNLGLINLAAAQWYCNERNCKSCFK